MPLTDAKIKALKPRAKAFKVSDYDSLYLQISPTGSKHWKFKYRLNGKERKLSFGKYPDVPLKRARFLRDEARQQVAAGIDPSIKKKTEKATKRMEQANSFKNVAGLYVEKITKEGRAETTLKKIDWVLGMAFDDFGQMPITEVTTPIILQCLKKREKLGHYETASRMRSTIGAVFRFAIASGLIDTDPTYALKGALIKPTHKQMAAITDKEELGAFLRVLDQYQGQPETRLGLTLLVLLAVRPGELRKARWEEFDFEKAVWHIPAKRMKGRRPHYVPLSSAAIDLLNELKGLTGWGELLFPSNMSSRKPISENTFNQALRRMGYGPDKVTSHGFRATFSTIANESGKWNPDAIERALAHAEPNAIRRAYDRGQHWEERVKMADWWAENLTEFRN